MSHTFRSTSKHEAQVPLTPTKAVRVIAAICYRNDTRQVIGKRGWQEPGKPAVRPMPDDYMGYVVPVDQDAMVEILGIELGMMFQDAMANLALREYYAVLSDKLFEAGITLAFARDYWYIVKLPESSMRIVNADYTYTLRDLVEKGPDGYRGRPAAQPKKTYLDD